MKARNFSPIRFLLSVVAIHLFGASLSWAAAVSMSPTTSLNTSVANPSRSNAFTMSWKAGLAGVNSQDDQNSAKFVSFGLEAQMNYRLVPEVFLNLDPKIKFENGSFQSLDGERKNESGVYLKEAGAHWMFATNSSLSAGALDQTPSHTDLLIGDQAFPAARARWQMFDLKGFQPQLEVSQAIPTSTSLSTNTNGEESTPSFTSAALALNYKPNAQYYWNTRVGAFSFENLPQSVAYESSLRGNTVIALTQKESEFVYEYQGVEASSELKFPVMRGWDFFGKAAYLQNNKAADKYGRAYEGTVGSEFFFIGRKTIEMSLTSFHIEPDAAVAYFNSNQLFNTNRNGYRVESYVNFRRYGFRVGAAYTEAELIYLNPVQSREKSVMLKLETFDANI